MNQVVLSATKREPGRNTARDLRKNGRVPGVYYANNQEPVHFSVPALSLRPVVYTAEAKMVQLEVDGAKGRMCILKDITFDPITDAILHIDLLGVAAGQKITVEIPLHITGQSVGIRNGGVIEHVMHKAHVLVDPTKMPEHIDVDITNLDINQSLHISDLSIPGVEFTEKADSVVVTCVPHRVAGEGSAPAAPEAEAASDDKA
ncbi:MAG: 50S ribosomal protein L25 [Bradyrhizobiaceae bacterium]|nr:50S ribosomal protein L25 [Bradyrhizobiaceae bacterium]